MTTLETISITANDKEAIAKKKEVIENLLENLTDNAFLNILYPKINKNPKFFVDLSNNPLIKML